VKRTKNIPPDPHYPHWSELSPKQLKALLRVYAPDNTPITPQDLLNTKTAIHLASLSITQSLHAINTAKQNALKVQEILNQAALSMQGLWTLSGFAQDDKKSPDNPSRPGAPPRPHQSPQETEEESGTGER
jgi:hypothetical protein